MNEYAPPPPRVGPHAVRWYILVLPAGHKGDPARGLRMESERNYRETGDELEFFAPRYVEVKRKGGGFVRTERPLLYNYVFIHSSEADIYRRQRLTLQAYSFLPRVRNGQESHYPYLSDKEMANLRWVADAYRGELPVYFPEPGKLAKGDRVRITDGAFKGVEATVAVQPGAGHKDVVVCLEGGWCVPLLHVSAKDYEIIGLNESGKHQYTKLSNDRILQGLHDALRHYHFPQDGPPDAGKALAQEAIRTFGQLQLDSDVMRCKQASILLMAYTVAGEWDERDKWKAFARTILPLLKAEQARALLLVTLYGCTDNNIYYREAHELVAPWRNAPNRKKSKSQLIRWLDDYDEWFGHPAWPDKK